MEARILLAGNVMAVVNGGDLVLTGDAQSNSVEVVIVNNDLVVQGLDNTTVNGADTPFVAFAASTTVTDDFFARLGAGDNMLSVSGIGITGRSVVISGAGDDSIGFDDTTVGTDLNINTFHGNDIVSLDGLDIDRDLIIRTKNHRDTVRIANSDIADDISIRAGKFNDAVVVDNVTVGDDVGINTGRGADDVVVMDSNIGDRLAVKTRRGDDFVFIDPTTIGGPATVRTGKHRDSVLIEGANNFNSLSINMGRGRDASEIDPATTISGRMTMRRTEGTDVPDAVRESRLNDPTDGALTKSAAAAELFGHSVNTAPTVVGDGIADVEVDEDAPNEVINLLDAFDDAEDGAAGLIFDVTNNTNESLFSLTSADNNAGTLTLGFAPDANGTANLTVTATDTGGLSVENAFMVTVNDVDEILLTLNALAGGGMQSNDTVITSDPTYAISGTTEADAVIVVDSDGDNDFDDGQTMADASGNFSVTVPLQHTDQNLGANTIRVQASNDQNQTTTENADIHLSVGTVVRFDINNVLGGQDTWDVELLDADAPRTVANFLGYADRYADSIIHRSLMRNFVIQGGGFDFTGSAVVNIPEDTRINNEFDARNSNVRSTLSMALPGAANRNDPESVDLARNSGTSEWFFNTVDNSVGLDAARHTVFGRVIGTGMDVVDAIEALPISDLSTTFSNGALDEVPLVDFIAGTPVAENFVLFDSISTILDSVGVENTFNVDANAADGTQVGQVTVDGQLGAEAIFEIDDPRQADELNLAPDDHLSGDAAAPVVVIEYLDFACPACKAAHEYLPQVKSDFGDDLLVVSRHRPALQNAFPASVAAEAAGRQGMFDEMMDQLFDNQDDWRFLVDPQSKFEEFADNLGLDLNQFQSDTADQVLTDRVQRDLDAANNLGVGGTPTFFVNGTNRANPGSAAGLEGFIQTALDNFIDPFVIDRLSGQLIVHNSADLDADNNPLFLYNVNASDTDGFTDTVHVAIDVTTP